MEHDAGTTSQESRRCGRIGLPINKILAAAPGWTPEKRGVLHTLTRYRRRDKITIENCHEISVSPIQPCSSSVQVILRAVDLDQVLLESM